MTNSQNSRVRKLRQKIGMTQKEFGEKIGVAQTYLSQIENGDRDLTDKIAKIICLQSWNGKTVREEWLRIGVGDMFENVPEEDETAAFVSSLLEDSENPLYDIIKAVMRTYEELSPKSQEVFRDVCAKLVENLNKEKES